MSTAPAQTPRKEIIGQPAWEIAQVFPLQGEWTEEDYFALPDHRRIELSNGIIEVLPMPTESHQDSIIAFFEALAAFARPKQLGKVSLAGIKVRLRKGKFREPDVLFMLAEHDARRHNEYWEGADLVMEVVSDDPASRKRDLKTKRSEYARAGIHEYWIVDPQTKEITVLRLRGKKYAVHGKFGPGSRASSALLKGFEVDVDSVLTAQ